MNTQLSDKIINEADEFMHKNGHYPDAVYLSEWQIIKLHSEISAWHRMLPSAETPYTFMGLELVVSPNNGPHFVSYD